MMKESILGFINAKVRSPTEFRAVHTTTSVMGPANRHICLNICKAKLSPDHISLSFFLEQRAPSCVKHGY